MTSKAGDKVCFLHFKEEDYWGSRLKRCIVVPSKNLPKKYHYDDGLSLVGPMNLLEFPDVQSSDHNYSVESNTDKVIKELREEISNLRIEKLKDSNTIKSLKRTIADLRRKVGTFRVKYQKILTGESLPQKTQNSIVSNKLLNSTSFTFSKPQISMILSKKKRVQGRDWTKQDWRMAGKMIHLKGKTVEIMRKEGILPTPSLPAFLHKFKWIHSIPGCPIKTVVGYLHIRKH